MPKISEKDINEDYFEKYLLTTITPDGTVIAIEKGKNEFFHGAAFCRLIKEMESVLKTKLTIKPQEDLYKNLNEFVKNKMIPISTYYIEQRPYYISSDMQVIKFPKDIKNAQLRSMKMLIEIFNKVGCVYFNEEGKKDSEEKNGLEELKKYINSKIKEIENSEER